MLFATIVFEWCFEFRFTWSTQTFVWCVECHSKQFKTTRTTTTTNIKTIWITGHSGNIVNTTMARCTSQHIEISWITLRSDWFSVLRTAFARGCATMLSTFVVAVWRFHTTVSSLHTNYNFYYIIIIKRNRIIFANIVFSLIYFFDNISNNSHRNLIIFLFWLHHWQDLLVYLLLDWKMTTIYLYIHQVCFSLLHTSMYNLFTSLLLSVLKMMVNQKQTKLMQICKHCMLFMIKQLNQTMPKYSFPYRLLSFCFVLVNKIFFFKRVSVIKVV